MVLELGRQGLLIGTCSNCKGGLWCLKSPLRVRVRWQVLGSEGGLARLMERVSFCGDERNEGV